MRVHQVGVRARRRSAATDPGSLLPRHVHECGPGAREVVGVIRPAAGAHTVTRTPRATSPAASDLTCALLPALPPPSTWTVRSGRPRGEGCSRP